MTHNSQRSNERFKPPGSNKSAPHKRGAQRFKSVHDRDKGGNLHTPYFGRSKGEETRTHSNTPTSKAPDGAENYMVVCAEGEKVVPESNIRSSVGTDDSKGIFDIDPRLREVERDVGPIDELEEVCIDERDTTKVIKIRKNLEAAVRT